MKQVNYKYAGILGVLVLVSIYIIVTCGHKYNHVYVAFAIGAFIISYCSLLAVWVDYNQLSIPQKLLVIASIFASYFLINTLQKTYVKYQLENYGISVMGLVTNDAVKVTTGGFPSRRRLSIDWEALIQYKYQGHIYTQSVGNNDFTYKEGDSVQMTCSSHDPEILKITGTKRTVH